MSPRRIAGALVALTLLPSVGPAAQAAYLLAPTPSVPARTEHEQAAYALAQELRDEKSVLFEAGHVFETGAIAQIAQNPALAEFEKAHPGIVKAMFAAGRPELERMLLKRLPDLWGALAKLIAAEMTDAEIAQAMAYYSSPEGRRFKAAMLQNYDYSQEIAAVAQDANPAIDAGAIRRGVENGVGGAWAALSAADRAALMQFATTPAFAKIKLLNPRIMAAAADWGNTRDPADETQLRAIMGETARAFLENEAKPKP